MNNYILLSLLLVIPGFLLAQEPGQNKPDKKFRYFNRTEAGVSFGLGSFKTDIYDGIQKHVRNDEIVIMAQTVNGISYKGRTGLGVGIGIEKWQHGLFFPVFGEFYYDLKEKGNTFFGTLSLGKSIGTRDSTSFYQQGDGGFTARIGIGYKMKIAKRLRFYYELFYSYQAIHSAYRNYVTMDSVVQYRTVDDKVPLSFVGFRIGISFY